MADITYIPTWSGFLYLAVVLDTFQSADRRLGDGDPSAHRTVLEALNLALWQRRPASVIHHHDQDTQYTSIAFGLRCREGGTQGRL